MKLYFAEAYTLKEDNWAAEIIGYSAEQLPNNEPPRSCPKNRQDCLKEKGPTEDGSLTGTRPTQTEAREDTPSGGAEISGRPRFSCKAIEAYKDSGIPCAPAAQAADIQRNTVSCCRPCFGLRIRPPNPASEGDRRDGPLRERDAPSPVEAISGSCGRQKKGQIVRSDLEEAATYSPTGKPQYHRRE